MKKERKRERKSDKGRSIGLSDRRREWKELEIRTQKRGEK
jgi:hypothetical protein